MRYRTYGTYVGIFQLPRNPNPPDPNHPEVLTAVMFFCRGYSLRLGTTAFNTFKFYRIHDSLIKFAIKAGWDPA